MDINLIFWINASSISAVVLALTGYVINVSQTACTLTGIKAVMTLYLEVCLLIAAIVIGFLYKLTDDQYAHSITVFGIMVKLAIKMSKIKIINKFKGEN